MVHLHHLMSVIEITWRSTYLLNYCLRMCDMNVQGIKSAVQSITAMTMVIVVKGRLHLAQDSCLVHPNEPYWSTGDLLGLESDGKKEIEFLIVAL